MYSATLTFAYVGGTENSVDVYLNSQNGAKIMSLGPGQQNQRLGIDYGNYTVHFRYWISDSQTSDGVTEIGWIESEIVNTEVVPIYVILNASRDERHLQVPHWNGGEAIADQYGTLEISNSTSLPIQVWIGSQLIEQVMYTDEPVENYSAIAANDVTTYTMPVGDFTVTARNITTNAEVSTTTLSVAADVQTDWTISN